MTHHTPLPSAYISTLCIELQQPAVLCYAVLCYHQLQSKTLDICRGALTLASPEVKFEIDTETHDPLDVGMYQVREANQMVEEMMLLANITVAEHILKHFPAQALLRRHPVPPPRQFEPLLKAAVAAGVSINPETSQVTELCQGCAMLLLRLCHGFAMGVLRLHTCTMAVQLLAASCLCHGCAMGCALCHGSVMVVPRLCHVWAIDVPWLCNGGLYLGCARVVPRLCYGCAMVGDHGCAMVVPCLCHLCAMFVPWFGLCLCDDEPCLGHDEVCLGHDGPWWVVP